MDLARSSDARSTSSLALQAPSEEAHDGGRLADFYQLGRIVGSGGFSSVRKAKELATGKAYACKVVRIRLPDATASSSSRGPRQQRMFQDELLNEIRLQSEMKHEYIVGLKEAFLEGDTGYVILEWLPGGDLSSVLLERGSLAEEDARAIVRKLLSALVFMHGRSVVHRDIKLENLLLSCLDDITSVKLADFGLARHYSPPARSNSELEEFPDRSDPSSSTQRAGPLWDFSGVSCAQMVQLEPIPDSKQVAGAALKSFASLSKSTPRFPVMSRMLPDQPASSFKIVKRATSDLGRKIHTRLCGTTACMAPELLTGSSAKTGLTSGYSPASDLWAVGVLLFHILSGYPPFAASDCDDGSLDEEQEVKRLVRLGKANFQDPIWDLISPGARHLIERMLTVNPKERITASDALQDPWLTGDVLDALPATMEAQRIPSKFIAVWE